MALEQRRWSNTGKLGRREEGSELRASLRRRRRRRATSISLRVSAIQH